MPVLHGPSATEPVRTTLKDTSIDNIRQNDTDNTEDHVSTPVKPPQNPPATPEQLLRILYDTVPQPKSEEQLFRDALDAALPQLGINPRLLIKLAPEVGANNTATKGENKKLKKRKREETENEEPKKNPRTKTPGEDTCCPWPKCRERVNDLWKHLHDVHNQVERYPEPKDHTRCNWDGCEFEGTSKDVISHFEDKHDRGHSVCGRSAPGAREPVKNVDEDNQGEGGNDAIVPKGKVQCGFSGCEGTSIQAGRTFERHAYGGHWKGRDFVTWCGFCGRWKRKDEQNSWRAHGRTCLRSHLQDYSAAQPSRSCTRRRAPTRI